MKINSFTREPSADLSSHLAGPRTDKWSLIGAALPDVRYAPITTIFWIAAKCSDVPISELAQLFDHLGGTHEERRRDREAKRFGGSHVDDEVEARGALKR